MRTNYVLVDLENVQLVPPESLDQLAQDHFKLLVFVGANQTKLPFEFAAAMQRLGSKAEYIKISGIGHNALDFHIAFHVGLLAAKEENAYFHIISKDTGFDPLLQHLKARKIFAGRVKAISDIPVIKASNSKSPAERLEVVLDKLRQMKQAKPRTVKTLSSSIATVFQKKLADEEVAELVTALVAAGHVTITDTKVSYSLHGDE